METITIEQIHKEWFTAAEQLACRFSQEKVDKVNEKIQRLQSLGFNVTKDNENLQELYDADRVKFVIDEYSVSHPMNKVISIRDVKRLCEKYDLVYGSLDRFTGFVPDKNLKEIEQFYHKDLRTWIVGMSRDSWGNGYLSGEQEFFTEISAKEAFDDLVAKANESEEKRRSANPRYYLQISLRERPIMKRKGIFLIAAPKKQMIVNDDEQIQDFKITERPAYPDPVVLFPIDHGNHFLIVTAWGDEASDEIVVNPKHN